MANKRAARYRRAVAAGQVSQDPATIVRDAPPNFGRMVLPGIWTFGSRVSSLAQVYRNPDEAVKDSPENARYMRNDPAIMECVEARQRAVALLNWHLEPEDEEDAVQKQLVDEMTAIIKQIPDFAEYRRNLLEAIWYGRYAVQHGFDFCRVKGVRRTTVKKWRPINGDKLAFRWDDGSGRFSDDDVGIRVGVTWSMQDGIAGQRTVEFTDFGPAYFLEPWERTRVAVHKHIIEDGAYEDPISAGRIHGVGVRDRIYWCWYQKQETMATLMEIIERTGSGFTIYYYPDGNQKAKTEVEDMAAKQKHDNILIMPRMPGDPAADAYGVERIEPNTAGISAMKEIVHEFFGHQIKRYVLGQILSSESAATGLGSGVADLHQDTFMLIIQYDATKLEETLTRDLVKPLLAFNFPKYRDVSIKFKIDTGSNESEKKMSGYKQAWDMGARIRAADVMDAIGASMPSEDEETLVNPTIMQQMRLWRQQQAGGGGEPGSVGDMFGPLAGMLGGDGASLGDQMPPDGAGPGGPGGGPEGGPDDMPPGPDMQPGAQPAQYAKRKRAVTSSELYEIQRRLNASLDAIDNKEGTYLLGKVSDFWPLAVNAVGVPGVDAWNVFYHGSEASSVVITPGHVRLGSRVWNFRNRQTDLADVFARAIGRLGQVAVERQLYAKKRVKPAPGQMDLFGGGTVPKQHAIDWKEELHPRRDDGKFAPKGEGAKKLMGQVPAAVQADEPFALEQQKPQQQRRLFDDPNMPPVPLPKPRPGTDLFGSPLKGEFKPSAVGKDAGKHVQPGLFSTKGAPDQMNLFADKGVPDDLVAKPVPKAEGKAGDSGKAPAVPDAVPTAGFEVADSRDVHNGRRVLKVGEHRARIVHQWFGYKTDKSKKKTWNEEIIAAGPKDWVSQEWERFLASAPASPNAMSAREPDSNSRQWKKNEDGTYTAPNGTVWRKAAAGGEVSPVTGKRFEGGQLMPIHGMAAGRPTKPEQPKQPEAGSSAKPSDQGGETKPATGGTTGPVSDANPADFAAQAQRIADAMPHGFGRNKVFISDVFDAMQAQNPSLTRDEFNRQLLAANRAGVLKLSRGDLVERMHPDDVERSETRIDGLPSVKGEHRPHFTFIQAAEADRADAQTRDRSGKSPAAPLQAPEQAAPAAAKAPEPATPKVDRKAESIARIKQGAARPHDYYALTGTTSAITDRKTAAMSLESLGIDVATADRVAGEHEKDGRVDLRDAVKAAMASPGKESHQKTLEGHLMAGRVDDAVNTLAGLSKDEARKVATDIGLPFHNAATKKEILEGVRRIAENNTPDKRAARDKANAIDSAHRTARDAIENAEAHSRGLFGSPLNEHSRNIPDEQFRDPHGTGKEAVGAAWKATVREALAKLHPEDPAADELRARAEKIWGGAPGNEGNTDILPGGQGDNRPDADFPADKLADGQQHEAEHTTNPQVAKEIAKDHLSEDGDYYDKLKAMEGATSDQLDALPDEPGTQFEDTLDEAKKAGAVPQAFEPETHGGYKPLLDLADRIDSGDISHEEYQLAYKLYSENGDAFKADLQKRFDAKKLKAIARNMSSWGDSGSTKSENADRIYDRLMLNAFHVGSDAFTYGMEGMHPALAKHVASQTPDSLRSHAEGLKSRQAAAQAAVSDPQTIDDFRKAASAAGGYSKLSPEHQAKYDDLVAKQRRELDKSRGATVQAFKGGNEVTGEVGIVEGHHKKRNVPTWTVTIENRLGDQWKEVAARAKQLGGNYVNSMTARMYGATPGIQFFSKEAAEKFANVLRGQNEDRSGIQQQRDIGKIENASERLAAMAAEQNERAQAELDKPRLANTARRADMAAGAAASARAMQAQAETMHRLSEAMANGEAEHLAGVRHRSHLDAIGAALSRAKWNRFNAIPSAERPNYDKFHEEPYGPADVAHAEYPYPRLWDSDAMSLAGELAEIDGAKNMAALIKRRVGSLGPQFASKVGGFKAAGGQVVDTANLREHLGFLPPEFNGKSVRVHKSTDARLLRGKHAAAFTADKGKTWGTTAEIAVAAAFAKGGKLDLIDTPQSQMIKFTSPDEVQAMAAVARKLQASPAHRRLGDRLAGQVEDYQRLQAADIRGPHELRAALREYLKYRSPPKRESRVAQMERDLIGRKIPGFFPTPRPIVDDMIDRAGIDAGMSVLEPSAGKGDILDAIRERHPDAQSTGIELQPSLRELLAAKGHATAHESDFLQHQGQYDRIVMNPPFENGQDADHVQHAYKLLKPGGRLVAIMSEGPFFRQDKKAAAFREWLSEQDGESEQLPSGAFSGADAFRQTGVSTRIVTIDKPKE